MKKILILLTIFLLSALITYGGDDARKGTTGADELLIPVGARGIATGGSMTASLTGLESIYYNPAGLALSQNTEAMFSYVSYLADINISYFAAATNLGDFGSIALSFKTLEFGDIPVTTVQFPDGTGNSYSPSYIIAGLTYSKVLTDRISIGTNFKLISEEIVNTSATGFAIDVGVQYKFSELFSLGAAIKNIGTNMSFSGPDLQANTSIPGSDIGTQGGVFEVVSEEFQIPSYFELSLTYNYELNDYNSLALGGTFTANNSLEDRMNLGLEYNYLDLFFIRGGYNLLLENSDQSVYGLTVGAGVDYSIGGEMGVVFDYAFRDVKDFPDPNHVFTVKLYF